MAALGIRINVGGDSRPKFWLGVKKQKIIVHNFILSSLYTETYLNIDVDLNNVSL